MKVLECEATARRSETASGKRPRLSPAPTHNTYSRTIKFPLEILSRHSAAALLLRLTAARSLEVGKKAERRARYSAAMPSSRERHELLNPSCSNKHGGALQISLCARSAAAAEKKKEPTDCYSLEQSIFPVGAQAQSSNAQSLHSCIDHGRGSHTA